MTIPGALDPSTAPLEVEVHVDDRAWDRLGEEWDALYSASPAAAPPLAREWMHAWWDVYGGSCGGGGSSLRLLTVRRGGALVGLLPLYDRRCDVPLLGYHRLSFLSTGEDEIEETCPDYLDLLALPGEEAACAVALRAFLVAAPFPWDRLDLLDAPFAAPILAIHGWPIGYRVSATSRGGCPSANLTGGFDAWLGRLPSRKREQPRRALREIERSGATFEVAGPSEVDVYFDDLVRLHQARWTAVGQPGCFAAPRFCAFHRRLAHAFVPDGRAVLARLSLDGRPLAALYGFIVREQFHFYQSGAAPDGDARLKSPGIAAHVLLMRHLAARGVTRYDFLRGSATYKDRLATDTTPLGALRVERPGSKRLAYEGALIARRALHRIVRSYRRRSLAIRGG